MGCIEFLIVLAMASLYFSIVPWCVGLDQLVTNIKLLQGFFKERWLGIFSANQPICEFAAIICLHTFDGVGKTLHTMLNKQCGRIGAVFWKRLQIAKPGVFINEGVLVPLCRLFLPYNKDLGNKFHKEYADLDACEGDESDSPTSAMCRYSASSSGKCTDGWRDNAPQPL